MYASNSFLGLQENYFDLLIKKMLMGKTIQQKEASNTRKPIIKKKTKSIYNAESEETRGD